MFKIIIRLAGVTCGDEDRQKSIKLFGCEDIGSFALVREPDNSYDPNAIRVEVAGHLFGYIPRAHAKDLAPLMDSGRHFIRFFCQSQHTPTSSNRGPHREN